MSKVQSQTSKQAALDARRAMFAEQKAKEEKEAAKKSAEAAVSFLPPILYDLANLMQNSSSFPGLVGPKAALTLIKIMPLATFGWSAFSRPSLGGKIHFPR